MNKHKKNGIAILVLTAGVILFLLIFFNREQAPELKSPPHIILMTLDTTRADRLGCYGYESAQTPALDALAKDGVLFTQCIAPAVLTLPVHCSLFTGIYPSGFGIHINGSGALSTQALTLAEILQESGYSTSAFIASFVLDARWGLKQGFDYYDDKIKMTKDRMFDIGAVQRPGNEIVDSAISWLDSQNNQKPLFMWLHFYDPHTPYDPPAEYRRLYPDTVFGRYDGEIAFMDAQIARFLEYIDQKGFSKNALIIAMGDHGEALGEHGEKTHGYFAYQGAIHVPFIIRFPAGAYKGQKIAGPVSHVDVLPTIIDYLKKGSIQNLHGHSLLPAVRKGVTENRAVFSESLMPHIQYGWAPINAIISGSEKFIDTPKAELFNLKEDPKEQNNIIDRKPVQTRHLRTTLRERLAVFRRNTLQSEAANLDQETLSKLASLGYANLASSRPGITEDERKRPDPKDTFPIYQKIERVTAYIGDEEYEKATEILLALLEEDEEVPQVRLLLASVYLSQNKESMAKVQLDAILRQNPDHIQALIAMANILKLEGQQHEMIALCKKAISLDENNTQAFSLIGEALMIRDQHEEALPYLERAYSIQPKLTQNLINLSACFIGLGRLDEAERHLMKAVSEYPDFATLHYHLGLIHHKRGHAQLAKHHYQLEIEHHTQAVPARFNLAEILFAEKDISGYKKELQAIIDISPDLARGYIFLARTYLTGDPSSYGQGIDLIKTGLAKQMEPQVRILSYYMLADFYSRLKQADKIPDFLEKARELKNKMNEDS